MSKKPKKPLPCPFCGNKSVKVVGSGHLTDAPYAVCCMTDGCHGGIWALAYHLFASEREAISAWNRRAPAGDKP